LVKVLTGQVVQAHQVVVVDQAEQPEVVFKALMVEQVELTAVVAEHQTVVMAEQVVAVRYVLFGPETCVNSHLHIQVTYLISLLMYLLWLVAAVVAV
jgi:hypothetical protein